MKTFGPKVALDLDRKLMALQSRSGRAQDQHLSTAAQDRLGRGLDGLQGTFIEGLWHVVSYALQCRCRL